MALYATHTILDEVKKQLNDPDGRLWRDTEYVDFIENRLECDIQVTLQRLSYADTIWRSYTREPIYLARFDLDPASPLTDATFDYRFNEYSLVYVPTSAETRDSITCSGVAVDFPALMVDIYRALASDAVRGAMKAELDGDKYDRSQHYDKMLRMAEQWQGLVML